MNFRFFHKSALPALDENLASQILENTFEACQVEPNSIPLEVLVSYSNYRKERFAFQKFVLVLIILLFCLLPFLFIYPNFTMELASTDTPYLPVYTINAESILPIDSIVASINGKKLPISQTNGHVFTVEPQENGILSVSVTLINNQTHTETMEVNSIDTTVPVFLSSSQENQMIYLYFSDPESGIDYQNITAVDERGRQVLPASYNEAESCVIFAYPSSALNVYIPDHAGNKLHLVLTIH